jgi:1-deoxy-D-xylulose 5-phosphate reductoisomerase
LVQRIRNFLLAHGSSYDPKIGLLIHNKETIVVAYKNLVEAIKQVQEGLFHPDRENDELTKALKNKEHHDENEALDLLLR